MALGLYGCVPCHERVSFVGRSEGLKRKCGVLNFRDGLGRGVSGRLVFRGAVAYFGVRCALKFELFVCKTCCRACLLSL